MQNSLILKIFWKTHQSPVWKIHQSKAKAKMGYKAKKEMETWDQERTREPEQGASV